MYVSWLCSFVAPKVDSFLYFYYCKLELTLWKHMSGEPAWVSAAIRYCLSVGSVQCLALQVATHEPSLFSFSVTE